MGKQMDHNMTQSVFNVSLSKDSREPFLELLRENRVAHEELMLKANEELGFIVDIMQSSAPWAGVLATVVCAFLKNRRSRKVIITTKDNQVIHCEGLGTAEIERILKQAKNLTAIETKSTDD